MKLLVQNKQEIRLTIHSCATHKMSEVMVKRLAKVKVGTHKITSKVTEIKVVLD